MDTREITSFMIHIYFCCTRLEWKGGQWRKQRLNLNNYQNSLLRILCQLFYQFQPDSLLCVIDKGLETFHSDESFVDLSSLGKSYKVCVLNFIPFFF